MVERSKSVALEVTFYFRQLSLSLQPTYRNAQFVYTNAYEWTDPESAANTLALNYRQHQKMDHLVLPLLVKYDLTATKLRPYIQAGAFAAFLIDAGKSVRISGTDYASDGENDFTGEPVIVGPKDLFATVYYGLAGGAGLNYHQGNVRLNLDIMVQYGMTNVVSPSERYGNDRLSGVGDVMACLYAALPTWPDDFPGYVCSNFLKRNWKGLGAGDEGFFRLFRHLGMNYN